MPGDAAALLVQEMERHAEQKREQHDRRGVMLREPRRRQRDRAGDQQAGIDRMNELCAAARSRTGAAARSGSMAIRPSMLS